MLNRWGLVAYGTRVVLNESCEKVVQQVTEALTEQNFVVVAELNLRKTFQTSLGVAMPDQFVLGVCRRPLADAALRAEPSLGLLLPMPVVVRAATPDVTVVEAERAQPGLWVNAMSGVVLR